MERETRHQGRYSVLSKAAARVTLWVAAHPHGIPTESPQIVAGLCLCSHQPGLDTASCGHTPSTGIY